MNKTVEYGAHKALDDIQERLTAYACDLQYADLRPDVVHAAKVRVIDTFGALIGGFFDEPSQLARNVAAEILYPTGATILGTRIKTTPDLAAFANGTASRSVEMNDYARKPGGRNGHPSDVVTPVFASAEHAKASGRDYITGVVLAYEVYVRLADAISDTAFDNVNFCTLGTAVAAGKLLGLSAAQLAQCISIAAVSHNALNQTRTGQLSMWKAVATGEAGRAGVFAAMLARKGMEGPHLPFEGKQGWCNHVAHKQLSLEGLGKDGAPFAVQHVIIKPRAACFHTLSPILAAEQAVAALKDDIKSVKHVSVEIYSRAGERSTNDKDNTPGVSPSHWWNPESRESADHSVPYTVAAALIDGTVTQHSFNDTHLWNPELRALLKKIEVVENQEFTAAYEQQPVEHRARVTVTTSSGERIVGESGGTHGSLARSWSDAEVGDKFRGLTEDYLGAKRVNAILDQVWNLESLKDVSVIPSAFVLD